METSLSRVEAILQNILGADNVLVPPQSRVEEILLAILNNTEYIHPGDPSRVEEILLAIKDGGSYDKKALSRVEDILIHKLNDEEYTDYSEDDLSRVEKLLIQWIDLHPEVIKELTTSSFPISILANGLPLLDYTIYGNTAQSGTPTPDNPIMPQGTGERTGNLWDNLGFSAGAINTSGIHMLSNNYGTSLSTVSGGSVDITQVASGSTTAYQNGFFFIEIDISQFSIGDAFVIGFDYEITNKAGSTSTTVSYVGQGNTGTNVIADWSNSGRAIIKATVTSAMKKPYVEIRLCGNSIKVRNIQINTGSTALPYEPYGYKIPISSANTTTPVYLGEVETTRKIRKWVLTGNESWNRAGSSHGYFTNLPSTAKLVGASGIISSHYRSSMSSADGTIRVAQGSIEVLIFDNYTSAAEFKAYLAAKYANGTPVTIWYVLATPETDIVNEPLCKIGDYADSVDFSQAGVEIPTLKKPNTTIIDVETSLEPSSMYLKYTEPSGPAPKTPVLGTKDGEIYVTPNNEIYVLRR